MSNVTAPRTGAHGAGSCSQAKDSAGARFGSALELGSSSRSGSWKSFPRPSDVSCAWPTERLSVDRRSAAYSAPNSPAFALFTYPIACSLFTMPQTFAAASSRHTQGLLHSDFRRGRIKPQQFLKLLRLGCDKRSAARDRIWAMSQVERHREAFQFQDLTAAINETAVDNSRRLRASMKAALAHLYGQRDSSPQTTCPTLSHEPASWKGRDMLG
jgi:hypothetical protein